MPVKQIAKVAVSKTSFSFDEMYSYVVPDFLQNSLYVGMRVLVPFGSGQRKRQALVLALIEEEIDESRLKPILDTLDKVPILSEEQVSMGIWLKDACFCTYFDAFSAMLPSGIHYAVDTYYELADYIDEKSLIKLDDFQIRIIDFLKDKTIAKAEEIAKILAVNKKELKLNKLVKLGVIRLKELPAKKLRDASEKTVSLNHKCKDIKLSPKQKVVYDFLKQSQRKNVSFREIIYHTAVSKAVISALEKKSVIKIFDTEVYRTPYSNITIEKAEKIDLTEKQQRAFEEIKAEYEKNCARVSLLYGVTGSGKTKVYTKLIDEVLADGKQVILMVPEISLTSHMIKPFKKRYGDKVAIYHSSLSMGERMDEWKRCKEGKASIILGTRSAIFVPFDNIGLIIMDEEQEYTYKSESSPRFNTRDVAKFRIKKHNALLLLASATPSLETYHKAQKGKYSLHLLKERYGKAKLPQVNVVDMNNEVFSGNNTSLSSSLIEALDENLANSKQSVLLLNRRGYNTFVSCRMCKEVLKCKNCSIALRYHLANGRLMCHCCGYSEKAPSVCPNCKNESLLYRGEGTQHIEKDIESIFPNARILRIDADSTIAKASFDEKFEAFKNKEYDIMLGTQMVAKGLDFPDVTLVGVLNADQALYGDDFRSYERAFSLITQVVGRAGRSVQSGKAIIQSYTPENNIIKLASEQDYNSFYESEIELRKMLLYPPFSDICMVAFSGNDDNKTRIAANDFFKVLTVTSKQEYQHLPLKVFTPLPASVIKISGKYRYKFIMKCRFNSEFKDFMKNLLIRFSKSKSYNGITAFVDINPYSFL